MLELYTDGSSSGGVGPGGWAFVAYSERGGLLHEAAGGATRTTNNRMEMLAIAHALRWSAGRECIVYSDSQLCINTLTQWAPAWAQAGWKKRTPGPIANLDIVVPAFELFGRSRAIMRWVRGHAGVPGNERADQLAGEQRLLAMQRAT